jgi:hypothetical protein
MKPRIEWASIVAIFWGIACLSGFSAGTTYYVAPNGNNANPGTEAQPWQTITKANQTLVAGDTVYIKAGTYSSYIEPINSGTAQNPIVFRNYGTDVVTISGAAYGVRLDGKSYITVQGINVTASAHHLYIINGAHHNTIAYCKFYKQQSPSAWETSIITGSSQYNWIHHTQMSEGGQCSSGGSDDGSVLDVGAEGSSTDLTRYNLIEDSVFFHGGHHVIGLHAGYNTIRNNYLYNEAWSLGKGNRTLYLNGRDAVTGHNVIEGNRFGYAAAPCDAETVGNVAMSTPYNIFRYNMLYHNNAYAIGTSSYGGYSNAAYNKIYNNTIFNSGYNINPAYNNGPEDTAINFVNSANTGNRLHNNLYFLNYQLYRGYTSAQTYANEWNGDTQGNPLFVNASATPPTNKADSSLPNLQLQATSPAINKGGALVTVAGADVGSGTSLVVTDAGYFQDGKLAPPGRMQADWIAVGTVGNIAQIASINTQTNTLTLTSAITRTDGAPVWLYRKSDGVRVLYGTAPDAGANESGSGSTGLPPAAPTGLVILP